MHRFVLGILIVVHFIMDGTKAADLTERDNSPVKNTAIHGDSEKGHVALTESQNNGQCDKKGNDCILSSETGALMIYDESFVSPFHVGSRQFNFGGKTFSIQQSWGEGGVAAVVWDAAVVLAEYLETNPHMVKDKKILELGAGTGLAGMVAAHLGATTTITDRETALKYLVDNVRTNFQQDKQSQPKIKALDWGKDLQKFKPEYDLIIGADIIYIEDTFDDLLKTLIHLNSCLSRTLLSCRIRYDRDTRFLKMLETHFNVKLLHHDKPRDIHIYECTLTKC